MTRKQHHGSNFESLLAEDGILEQAHVEATAKLIAARIAQSARREDARRDALSELVAISQELGLE